MRIKKQTTTSKVVQVLRAADDFMSKRMLEAATGDTRHQIESALLWLRSRGVVDVVVGADGVGWWFALPPDSDQRSRTTDEIAIHDRPRARRPRPRRNNEDR